MAFGKNWYVGKIKYMTVDQLKRSLDMLPSGAVVATNQVHNLMVLDQEGNYLGYIDFGDTEPNFHESGLAVQGD